MPLLFPVLAAESVYGVPQGSLMCPLIFVSHGRIR